MRKNFSIAWFCMGFLSFLCIVPLIFAQDVKKLSWQEFWSDIRFVQDADGKWDFTHAKRPLTEYTTVAIPPRTLTVKSFFPLESSGHAMMALVVLGQKFVQVHNQDATQILSARDASVRFLFICKRHVPPEVSLLPYCQQALDSLLENGLTVQSTGSGNVGYERTGTLPDKIIFGFLVKHSQENAR